MTTDTYIKENKTPTLQKGDKVKMYNCHEANYYGKDKIWTCETDSFLDKSGDEVVFIENYSGTFLVKYLKTI